MPDTVYGQAATIANLPRPAATVNISSSTNATPIVVTTAAAHGLQTGYIVIISGHATNTAANGIRKAIVLSSTTFSLQTIAGTDVAGVGVGGATGVVQSLALAGFQVPTDATDLIDAASVNVGFEALADMAFFLAYTMWSNMQILKGGTLTFESGSDGIIEEGATVTCNGVIDVTTTGITSAMLQVDDGTAQFINGAKFYNYGDEAYADPQRLTAADHTISAHDGQIVILDKATGTHTITVEQATDPPLEGQYVTFWMWDAPTVGNYYRIKREGSGNYIVELNATIAGSQEPCFCRIHVESGVWRLTGGVGLSPGLDA